MLKQKEKKNQYQEQEQEQQQHDKERIGLSKREIQVLNCIKGKSRTENLMHSNMLEISLKI
jgi:hypothetical protein